MKSNRKNILVLCPYPFQEAAGQRLKYEQYFSNWKEHGFSIELSPFMDQGLWKVIYEKGFYFKKAFGILKGYLVRIKDLFIIHKYDIIYIHQWTTPFGTKLYDIIARQLGAKVIYDLEDFVIYKEQLNESRNPILKHIRSNSKIKFWIKNADHVITSSPELNKYCVSMNRYGSATFISSSVDTSRFLPVNRYKNDHKIVIGWTGTFSSIKFLDLLKNVLLNLNSTHDFKLRVIANCDYQLPDVDVEVIKWTKNKEVEDLQGIDIGVYPLENSKWVLGKSGLKAIQYMAFGIPTVATSVGTSKTIINHMSNGWLATSEDEWLSALKTLIENPELRQSMGRLARETIVSTYSLEAVGSQYLEILKNI